MGLARKIDLCSIVFDLEKDSDSEKDILVKEATLEDICDYVTRRGSMIGGSMQVDIMEMVAKNIFRTFPPPPPPEEAVIDDTFEYLDPGWPHLGLVYKVALKVLERPDFDPDVLRNVINKQFLANLFQLFTSQDARERDYLKTILHRIYGTFLSLRTFIRSTMSSVFLTVIHDQVEREGISELLEVLGAIIKGLAVPLKIEHLQWLHRILLPLYSAPGYLTYSAQLSYCTTQLITKDSSLAVPVVRGLIKTWPRAESAREQVMIVQTEYFHRVGQCVASQHFLVAERALQVWGNNIFREIIRTNIAVAMPILLPYIFSCRHSHWNVKVVELSEKVLEVMDQIDQEDLQMERLKLQHGGDSWNNKMSEKKIKKGKKKTVKKKKKKKKKS